MSINAHVCVGSLINVFESMQLKKTAEGAIDWRHPYSGAVDYVKAGTPGIVLAIEKIGSNKEGRAFFLFVGNRLGWVANYEVIEEVHGK